MTVHSSASEPGCVKTPAMLRLCWTNASGGSYEAFRGRDASRPDDSVPPSAQRIGSARTIRFGRSMFSWMNWTWQRSALPALSARPPADRRITRDLLLKLYVYRGHEGLERGSLSPISFPQRPWKASRPPTAPRGAVTKPIPQTARYEPPSAVRTAHSKPDRRYYTAKARSGLNPIASDRAASNPKRTLAATAVRGVDPPVTDLRLTAPNALTQPKRPNQNNNFSKVDVGSKIIIIWRNHVTIFY